MHKAAGGTIVELTPEQRAVWRKGIEAAWPKMVEAVGGEAGAYWKAIQAGIKRLLALALVPSPRRRGEGGGGGGRRMNLDRCCPSPRLSRKRGEGAAQPERGERAHDRDTRVYAGARLRMAADGARMRRRRSKARQRVAAELGIAAPWLPQRFRRGGPAPMHRQACAGGRAWHRGECWVAVAAFGFIAAILLLDVIGREFVGPVLRFVGLDPGATGIFAAQKLSVFALVIGSFAGIGIATATGSHIVPRFAYAGCRRRWGPAMDRLADVLTGMFLVVVAWLRLQVRRLLLQDRLAGAGARLGGVADPAGHPARASCRRRGAIFSMPPGRRSSRCRRSSRNEGCWAHRRGAGPAGAAPAAARRAARRRRLRAPVLGPRQPRGHHRGHVGRASTRR